MKQMIFFNQLPRYIHITKKEMSGTLYFDDMNERCEYENERREEKEKYNIYTYRTKE
jgi:hypothetical protein